MDSLPTTPSFRLDGKRALVVGASSGIGQGAAIALVEAGASVCLVARNLDKLNELKMLLTERETEREIRSGLEIEVKQMDITDIDKMKQFLDENQAYDILVNSAGMARHGNASDAKVEDFNQVMDVNVKSAYFLTRNFAEKLRLAKKPGSIINISSQMGHVGGIKRSVYCASKFAVEGFTKSMAIEYGLDDIRINTVCPTFIKTALTESTFEDKEVMDWIMSKIKLGRIGTIEDVMGPVVFLASDAAALITGSALMVDGGWTAE